MKPIKSQDSEDDDFVGVSTKNILNKVSALWDCVMG